MRQLARNARSACPLDGCTKARLGQDVWLLLLDRTLADGVWAAVGRLEGLVVVGAGPGPPRPLLPHWPRWHRVPWEESQQRPRPPRPGGHPAHQGPRAGGRVSGCGAARGAAPPLPQMPGTLKLPPSSAHFVQPNRWDAYTGLQAQLVQLRWADVSIR